MIRTLIIDDEPLARTGLRVWLGKEPDVTVVCADSHPGRRLVRATVAELAANLDQNRFARIHRSTIVQIDCIREIVPEWHGDFQVLLKSGTTVRMSRGFRERLLPGGKRSGTPSRPEATS